MLQAILDLGSGLLGSSSVVVQQDTRPSPPTLWDRQGLLRLAFAEPWMERYGKPGFQPLPLPPLHRS